MVFLTKSFMVLVFGDWFSGYEIGWMDMRFAQHPSCTGLLQFGQFSTFPWFYLILPFVRLCPGIDYYFDWRNPKKIRLFKTSSCPPDPSKKQTFWRSPLYFNFSLKNINFVWGWKHKLMVCNCLPLVGGLVYFQTCPIWGSEIKLATLKLPPVVRENWQVWE